MSNPEILAKIRKYALSKPVEETCGLIIESLGEASFIPCRNYHPKPEVAFRLSAKDFLSYENIKYIYHSHPKGSATPSEIDASYSDELQIPFLIYSLSDDDFYIYENKSV